MALLQIEGIARSFDGEPALRDVSLAVEKGEIVALLGPSGCGKTTLLRIVAGLERPDAGQVRYAGEPLDEVPPHRRGFGLMFQELALFPHMDVFRNVAFGLRMQGLPRHQVRQRVRELLQLVDLEGYERRSVHELSGGERQRVALARSLAPNPRLLMLDEPLGALDRNLRQALSAEIRRILKRLGVTALYVTHDQEEAFAIADRVAVMSRAQIQQVASPVQLLDRPATVFVAHFLGFRNLLPGVVEGGGRVRTAVGTLPVGDAMRPPGSPVTLLIPDDALTPLRPGESGLRGVVRQVTAQVKSWHLELAMEEGLLEVDAPLGSPWGALRQGERVSLGVDASRLRVLPASQDAEG